MADREDSIHIRIKIDIDAEDKAFVDNLSSEMARADEQRLLKRETPQEEKPDDESVKKDIHQEVKSEQEQIDAEIRELQKEIKQIEVRLKKGVDPKDPEIIKAKLEAKKDQLLLKQWKAGPVGTVASFTTEQTSNLRRMVTNPAEILISAFTKKLGRIGGAAAKGGLIAILALIVYDLVLFAIDQYMQPGRLLDRRFKRIARLETMNFYERTLQEEIRHGYAEIRVTSMQGLRGGASQVNGNLFEFGASATGIIQSSPYRSSQVVYRSNAADGVITDSQGSPKRRTVSGRFG